MADNNTQGISNPDVPPVPAPHGGAKNGEGVMVFQTGAGELPNVIQYLNFSRYTGQLEVDPKNLLGERGVICFRDGEAYYARQGIKRGADAIVEMVGFMSAEGVFFPGGSVQAQNIDIPTRDLILKVAVEADEREPHAPSQSDNDEFFLGDQPTSRIVVRENKPENNVKNVYSGERKGRWWLVALILLAVGAFIINGVWFWGELQDRKVRRLEARELAAKAEKQAALQVQRQKKIDELLFDSIRAFKNSEFRIAEEKAEAVLAVDPGNKRALNLQQRVSEAIDLSLVIPLSKEAASVRGKMDSLLENPLFKQDAAAICKQHEQGALYFQHSDYKKAIIEFRACLEAADGLLARHRHYEEAQISRKNCRLAQSRAVAARGSEYADDLFKQALAKEKTAAGLFEQKTWEAAGNTWEEAARLFASASGSANDFANLRASQAAFENSMGKVNEQVLNEYAAAEAKLIQKNSQKALELETAGDLILATEMWKKNAKLLGSTWEKASRSKSAAIYSDRMKVARDAIQRQDWERAVTALDELVALEEFKQNSDVISLWEKACYGRYASQLPALQAGEDWVELKAVAQEILYLRPGDTAGEKAKKMAEDKLLPRLEFSVTSQGRVVTQCDIKIKGAPAVAENPLMYRLTLGGEYTFNLELPQVGGTYFKPVTFEYGPARAGLRRVKIDIQPVSPPQLDVPWTVPGTTLKFAPVPSGTFKMGSNKRGDEQPPHTVNVTRAMWVAETETTNQQFYTFIKEDNYDGKKDCRTGYLKHFSEKTDVPDDDLFPIVYISWKNAQAFCQWLTRREKLGKRLPDGYVYRLPTEAEWEYVCRAGATEDFAGNPLVMAWHGNRSNNTARTGLLKPNKWGLYDMHGNVWEFCQDWHGAYSPEGQTDPVGPRKGIYKVIRGGSWRDSLEQCRSSWRSQVTVAEPRNNVGFRVVLAPAL